MRRGTKTSCAVSNARERGEAKEQVCGVLPSDLAARTVNYESTGFGETATIGEPADVNLRRCWLTGRARLRSNDVSNLPAFFSAK
jgi:hypothetical protein